MPTFTVRGSSTLPEAPEQPGPNPPEVPEPRAIPSREGENLDFAFNGDLIELKPRIYTSSGKTDWWSYHGGVQGLTPGNIYRVRLPYENSQKLKRGRRSRITTSFDGLDISRMDKAWLFQDFGQVIGDYVWQEWTLLAESSTLDISMGLPATWGMVDTKLLTEWAPFCEISPASVGPGFEVARTPAAVDQQGQSIPEQIQRLWRIGNGPLTAFITTAMHSPEVVGTRAFIHFMDLLVSGDYDDVLSDFTFVVSHTMCPGRYRGHNRGYAVGSGSTDPNRSWGQNRPDQFFLNAMEDAMRTDGGGQINYDWIVDMHGQFRGGQKIFYSTAAGNSLAFHDYIPSNRFRRAEFDAVGSTNTEGATQWGATCAMTPEWSGATDILTDQVLRADAADILAGARAALADGYW